MIEDASEETKKRVTMMISATMEELHDIVVHEFEKESQLHQLVHDPTRYANNIYMLTMNFCINLQLNTLRVIQQLNNEQEKKQNNVS